MFDYLSGCQNSDLNYIFTFEGGLTSNILTVNVSFIYKFDNISIIFIMNPESGLLLLIT